VSLLLDREKNNINMRKGIFLLEDGKLWEGEIIGEGIETGEVIFYTGVIGYQEVITDPSYYKKIVVMTYPHIGNYGINKEGFFTENVWVKGLIVKEISKISSNWKSIKSIKDFINENKILVMEKVDTQEVVSYLREKGIKRGILAVKKANIEKLLEEIKNNFINENLTEKVSCKKPHTICSGKNIQNNKILVIDLGVIKPHIDYLISAGFDLIVAPYNITSDEIFSYKPRGVFISSGPDNPLKLQNTISELSKIIGKIPVLGIGLGMLILSLSLGYKIFKMKNGHFGINYPVKDVTNNTCKTTVQAHIYSLIPENMDEKLKIWFTNLNDGSIEGIISEKLKILGVQYYPQENDIVWRKFKEFVNA